MGISALLSRAAELIHQARHPVAFTGAGVSTPSGIPDFRSLDSGLWSNSNPFLVASIYAFRIRPQLFYDWIRPLARTFFEAVPNPAHLALAELEGMGRLEAVITQNIDNLHQAAGSRNVIQIHGHMREATCVRCYRVVATQPMLSRFTEGAEVPRCCECGGALKPNLTLFGEQLPVQAFQAARRVAQESDLMLVAGTSLNVAPAADLPYLATENCAQVIVVNQQPTLIDERAAVVVRQDVASALPAIVERVRTLDGTVPAGPGPGRLRKRGRTRRRRDAYA